MDALSGQHQEMGNNSLDSMLVCSKTQQDRKPRPQPEQALKCPRCDSTNTKFCYYNNYSLSQPRYFCKSCRRYWTKGGTLRNVPVGGGCRKNKRSSSAKRTCPEQPLSAAAATTLASLPPLSYDSNDLTLAFARLQKQAGGQMGFDDHDMGMLGNPGSAQCDVLATPNIHASSNLGFLDTLRTGFLDTQHNNVGGLFYGFGSGGGMGEADNGGGSGGPAGEMLLPYDDMSTAATTNAVTVTTVKQEFCNPRESENRVFWGFPWQLNGDANMGDLGPSWHGLLNSPLM